MPLSSACNPCPRGCFQQPLGHSLFLPTIIQPERLFGKRKRPFDPSGGPPRACPSERSPTARPGPTRLRDRPHRRTNQPTARPGEPDRAADIPAGATESPPDLRPWPQVRRPACRLQPLDAARDRLPYLPSLPPLASHTVVWTDAQKRSIRHRALFAIIRASARLDASPVSRTRSRPRASRPTTDTWCTITPPLPYSTRCLPRDRLPAREVPSAPCPIAACLP